MVLLEKAVAQFPQSAEAHYQLANACAVRRSAACSRGPVRPQSKRREREAVAINPKLIEARLNLVQFYAFVPASWRFVRQALEQAKAIKAIDPIVGHVPMRSSIRNRRRRPGEEGIPGRDPRAARVTESARLLRQYLVAVDKTTAPRSPSSSPR